MGFYDLNPRKRKELVNKIENEIEKDLKNNQTSYIYKHSSDPDTYIRRNTYLSLGRIYQRNKHLRNTIIDVVKVMLDDPEERIRQTATYTLGEIGKSNFTIIINPLEQSMEDKSRMVRNAVVGSLKQLGQENPKPTLKFAREHIHNNNPEVRREVVHGVELRGRTHPEDVLPLLEDLQDEKNVKVKKTIIHVLGQISYKKGCLEKVTETIRKWHNQDLVDDVKLEIIQVHKRYKFAFHSPDEVEILFKSV